MHPVGPEDVRTYWIRRGGAIAVLLVLMIGLGLIVSNLGGTDGNAAPAETTAVPAAAEATEPAATQAQLPPPAQPGSGVPNDVTQEEAVPIPSSARTARATPQSKSRPDPEPANTFHLTTGTTPPPTR